MKIEVTRYRKPDGYATRFWSVTVDGELLAVTVYRRGANAVANALTTLTRDPHVTTLEDAPQPGTVPHHAPDDTAGQERLRQRKVESGLAGRDDVKTFVDLIDADEKRT